MEHVATEVGGLGAPTLTTEAMLCCSSAPLGAVKEEEACEPRALGAWPGAAGEDPKHEAL